MIYTNFQEAYIATLNYVKNFGDKVTVRGLDMRELIPHYFEISNSRDRLLNLESRKSMYRYIFGELLWYLSGRDDVEFIDKYAKMWKTLSDDGIHCNSAYGKFIFRQMPTKGFGTKYDNNPDSFMSQWDYVKETLRKDPFSRQAVIQIKPIQMYNTKDVTCTYFLQFFIRNNKLDLVVGMRSNDLIFGTPFDVFMFTFFQELMATELGIEPGVYKHFVANMHIYDKDMDKVDAILNEGIKSTVQFDHIPVNFRQYDLPILLELEDYYWKNDKVINNVLYNKLSNLGKQLVNLLNYN